MLQCVAACCSVLHRVTVGWFVGSVGYLIRGYCYYCAGGIGGCLDRDSVIDLFVGSVYMSVHGISWIIVDKLVCAYVYSWVVLIGQCMTYNE